MEKQSPFSVRPGIYVVPDIGRVDANKQLSNTVLVKLYLNPSFPFITLNPDGVTLLKKEKLGQKQIASLILRAKDVQEIDLLLEVNTGKTLKMISSTKKESLAD